MYSGKRSLHAWPSSQAIERKGDVFIHQSDINGSEVEEEVQISWIATVVSMPYNSKTQELSMLAAQACSGFKP
jgi:hypothetical protein